jgi:hypothetical protein
MPNAKHASFSRSATLLFCAALLCCGARGQSPAQTPGQTLLAASDSDGIASDAFSSSVHAGLSDLPDAPQSQAQTPEQAATTPAHQDGQTKRILGIIPNFRAVSADVKLPPQPIKEKFITATQDSFDYSTIFLPAVLAGYSQLEDKTPEFHQGAAGYARYYWHSYVDQTSENYFVEFIGPVIFRQDSRYYTLGKGGFVKRTVYSLSRAVITRDDAGKEVFNYSEVLGAGFASGLSNLYYPSKERTFGNTAGQWGQDVGIDAATFMFKEFWPDINHKLFHGHSQ